MPELDVIIARIHGVRARVFLCAVDKRLVECNQGNAGVVGMSPYRADPWLTVYHFDAAEVLRKLPAASAQIVVTSPP